MKYKQLLFIILLVIPSFLLAQKMISIDNRWYFYDLSPISYYSQEYAAFFRDSVKINGHYYYQLYRTVDSLYKLVEPTNFFYREEKEIVYRLNNVNNKEDTIYNFDVKVGQTIIYNRPVIYPTYQIIAIVYSIDTVVLKDGSKRKKISMYNPLLSRGDDYYIRSYIKGIGSTLLGTFAPEQIFDGVGVLFNCFYSRGEYLFGSYEPRCVNIYHKFPLGTETIQELEGLQITQHTGDGNFVFELKNKGKYGCKIYNAQGAMLSNPLVNQGSNHVSLVDFPKGMYFIQVYELESQRQKTLKMLWQ